MNQIRTASAVAVAIMAALAATSVAQAQAQPVANSSGSSDAVGAKGLEEIIVTAQKRNESINDVPLSINTATGTQLSDLGIRDVSGLVRLVPGFNAIDSGYGTPVYFMRGVGFFDSSLAAKSTVSVYVDEVPIPFSIMTTGIAFDLERVEVLKGPQGTLFGQNATGGAINYIAAKPTEAFEAGALASYGKYDYNEIEGHVSGPLADTLKARLAIRHEGGDDWQESYTRNDSLGSKDLTQARGTLEWDPTDSVRTRLTLNLIKDKSDTQAAQLVAPFRQSAGYFDPRLVAYPLPPEDNNAADWGDTNPLHRDNTLQQAGLRIEWDIKENLTLTSLTSYADYDQEYGQDSDGTNLRLTDLLITGQVEAFNQELRLAGSFMERGNWLVGANYEDSKADEKVRQFLSDQSSGHVFDRLGLPPIDEVPQIGNTDYTSTAIFANGSYPVTDTISLTAGIRYTETDIDFEGCAINGGNGTFGKGLETLLRLPAGTFQLNECATLGTNNLPTLFTDTLSEDNTSWRAAFEWRPTGEHLVYASVGRGYKAGSYANLPATQVGQYAPVTQEEVTAYEVGFKSTLLDNALQLNGAVFLYDYSDKQLKGRTIVPIFGPLEALVNIPKSEVKGVELQVIWEPIEGLNLNAGATHLDTEVTESFINYTAFGVATDFKGTSFPYTPEWQMNADVGYHWPVNAELSANVGANYTYRTSTNGDFVEDARLDIDSYGLLDLRAGVGARDGKWDVSVWGRNVTDEYYWQTAARRGDAVIRYTGMPVTYGVTVKFNYR